MASRRELLDALGTSEEELALNRAGRLSPRQTKAVHGATRDDAASMTGLAIVLAVVLWGILGYIVHDGRLFRTAETAGDAFGQFAIVLVAGVLPAAGVGWAIWTWVVHARTSARAESREGVIELRTQRHRQTVLHQIRIDDRTFVVNERLHALLDDGARYRVCFVPVADVVVSVEPIEG